MRCNYKAKNKLQASNTSVKEIISVSCSGEKYLVDLRRKRHRVGSSQERRSPSRSKNQPPLLILVSSCKIMLQRKIMSTNENGVHLLVFPYPAQGHMLALLDLTHQLSLRGLCITILVTPKNLQLLQPILAAKPCIQTLVLPFPPHSSIPPGVENVKDIGNHGNIPIMTSLRHLQGQIIQWFESHPNPPTAILSDFFLGWTHQMAQHLGIPSIAFFGTGAFLSAGFSQIWEDAVEIGDDIKLQDLPHAPTFTWEQAPSLFRRYMEAKLVDPSLEFVRTSMIANGLSWAAVINTFDALEHEFLEYLREKMGHPRVFSVGPLNLFNGPSELRTVDLKGDSISTQNDRILSWLDGFKDGSVLYVCFGSQKLLKKAQMEALADGLERSGIPLIWVVKPLTADQVSDGFGTVPDGFEERVMDRGLVIKGWAPQLSILNHRAIGGFLSHCGWNSVLEAIAAGVMILGWPMEADQFFNAKLLVEYRNAALLVCEGGEIVPNPVDLAQKITNSMHGDAAERMKAKELNKKALEAVEVGGSSNGDLDALLQVLSQLKDKSI